MLTSIAVLALFVGIASPVLAQSSVVATQTGTLGINGMGSEGIGGELTVSNIPSQFNFPLKRAFLVFPTDAIPSVFDSCVLQVYETTREWRGERIDVSIIPSQSQDYSSHFDYVFSETLHFCNPLTVQGVGIVSVDVSQCVRSALQPHPEYLIIRLAAPLYSGGQHYAAFAPTSEYQSPPRTDPEPQLIFAGAVANQPANLGAVKSLFR